MRRVTVKELFGFLGAVAIAITGSPGDTPAGGPSIRAHAPIQVRRNDDGTVARGPRNEVVTSNWSGFALANFETGQFYTAAQATWKVPAVTFDPLDKSGTKAQYSSTWVGIGGFCENAKCTKGDHSLIQLGTDQNVAADGTTSFDSWYELLPAFPVLMDTGKYPVSPGDTISASLECSAPCVGKRQSWTLAMSNLHKWQWSVTVTYTSPNLSAEWIEEAPSGGGVLPLADFGTVTIDPTVGTGEQTPVLTVQQNGIQMSDPYGQTANPSSTPGASFDICWGSGGKYTRCP